MPDNANTPSQTTFEVYMMPNGQLSFHAEGAPYLTPNPLPVCKVQGICAAIDAVMNLQGLTREELIALGN